MLFDIKKAPDDAIIREPDKLASASSVMLAHRITRPRWTVIENFPVDGIEVLAHHSKEPSKMFISPSREPMRLYRG